MRLDRLPITYDECRARFHEVAIDAGVTVVGNPIEARGMHGQLLSIDIATLGATEPSRVLLVLSGVHGVEGFVNSTLQTDLLTRLDPSELADGVAVILVHVINPWGMSHGRRQNESNVDLNRNWRRSDHSPEPNDDYDELHHLACPDTTELPDARALVPELAELVRVHGVDWVADAITKGQYRHADGLHFGGHTTEESCRVLERELAPLLATARRVLTLDLHTGVGASGTLTLLSSQPTGSPQDVFARNAFGDITATVGNPDAVSKPKSGPIASGIADLAPTAECFSITAEFGTASDMAQLAATYQEQWVHRHGDLTDPTHVAARRRYRDCFTPNDPHWEASALELGRRTVDQAIAAVNSWA